MERNPDLSSVTHDQSKSRFKVSLGDREAVLVYELRDGKLALLHTEVPQPWAGRGIATALARAALNYARSSQLQVIPLCGFVSSYIRRHPEYMDLVEQSYKDRVA